MTKIYAAIRTANENFITTCGAMRAETARDYFTDGVNTRVYPVDIQFYDAFPDFLLLENDWSATSPSTVKKAIALAAKYHENEVERIKTNNNLRGHIFTSTSSKMRVNALYSHSCICYNIDIQ